MMGGGLCWLDVEGDGWLDLYVVNSHASHEIGFWADRGGLPRNALFQNQGDGTFKDISANSGADLALRGNGCIAGDIDQDGDTDIYITADGPNALLLNQGNGEFIESAEAAGVASPEWNTAAAMGDYDKDGLIDLYVASYIDLGNAVPEPVGLFPQDYYGLVDHLYRNLGNGSFEDVALEAGLQHQERGLGALFSDLDQDGDLDLYVANDGNPNRLYLNQGDGTFGEDSRAMGVDDRGSGMGVSMIGAVAWVSAPAIMMAMVGLTWWSPILTKSITPFTATRPDRMMRFNSNTKRFILACRALAKTKPAGA
jgi:hypothetical protein